MDDTLKNLISKLKNNKEKVGVETLKTQYAVAYHNLLVQIKSCLENYIKSEVLTPYDKFTVSDSQLDLFKTELIPQIQEVFNKYTPKFSDAAYKEMDVEKIDSLVQSLKKEVSHLYQEYLRTFFKKTYNEEDTACQNMYIVQYYNTMTNELWVWSEKDNCLVKAGKNAKQAVKS